MEYFFDSKMFERKSKRSSIWDIPFIAMVGSVLFVATLATVSVSASAAMSEPQSQKESSSQVAKTKLPLSSCETTVRISTPQNGAYFFEDQNGLGSDGIAGTSDDDGYVPIEFSGSLSNPCKVVPATLHWEIEGSMGPIVHFTGPTTVRNIFAGCGVQDSRDATLMAYIKTSDTGNSQTWEVIASKTITITVGRVC